MFKGYLFFFISVWLLICAVILASFFRISPSDRESYQNLLEKSDKTEQNKENAKQSHQQRFNVHKTIFFSQGKERLQLKLQSERSNLFFEKSGGHSEIVEHFKGVRCAMQEELYYLLPDETSLKEINENDTNATPFQTIRIIEAEEGTYHYKTRKLFAERATFQRYRIPGHELISSLQSFHALMNAKAQKVELSLSNKERHFKVQKLHMSLQNQNWVF